MPHYPHNTPTYRKYLLELNPVSSEPKGRGAILRKEVGVLLSVFGNYNIVFSKLPIVILPLVIMNYIPLQLRYTRSTMSLIEI